MPEFLQERNERIKELEDEAAERERDNRMQTALKDDLINTLQQQNRTLAENAGNLRGAVTTLKEQLKVGILVHHPVSLFNLAVVPRC